MTEIETVTVSFEEFKAKLQHYMELQEEKRVVVMHEGEVVAAIGPWLPDEERFLSPRWFFDDLFPPQPINPEDPYALSRALDETREDKTYT
jgi:hypothetical protein